MPRCDGVLMTLELVRWQSPGSLAGYQFQTSERFCLRNQVPRGQLRMLSISSCTHTHTEKESWARVLMQGSGFNTLVEAERRLLIPGRDDFMLYSQPEMIAFSLILP